MVSLTTLAEDEGGEVVSKYKLAALTGLQHSAMSSYMAELDPRGKQCVLLSLGHEFSGEKEK